MGNVNNEEFENIAKKLKKRSFIAKDRKIIPSTDKKIQNIGFASVFATIQYYPEVINYFGKNEIYFILLHEEYHCLKEPIYFPYISEHLANKYARKKLLELDPTMDIEKTLDDYNKHVKIYRDTTH